MDSSDAELKLLETIYSKQNEPLKASQRELAGATGLSLGMTNALLKRFVERGWIKLTHLSGRKFCYILTPDGMEETLRRSLLYFVRAMKSSSLYRDKIDRFVRDLALRGFKTLSLEGPDELDFLFDYSCARHGLSFIKSSCRARRLSPAGTPGLVIVRTERCIDVKKRDTDSVSSPTELPENGIPIVLLRDIILDGA